MEGLLNLGLNASFWLAQVMYLFAEIKQLTQYMQSECFFNDFSIMNSAILLKVVSFIVYSWVSSVNSVFWSKHTLYTFYSKERVFSTLYFVFELLLLLRVIVLNIPSKMRQLVKRTGLKNGWTCALKLWGSSRHSIFKMADDEWKFYTSLWRLFATSCSPKAFKFCVTEHNEDCCLGLRHDGKNRNDAVILMKRSTQRL